MELALLASRIDAFGLFLARRLPIGEA
jgi:hypothetical protein